MDLRSIIVGIGSVFIPVQTAQGSRIAAEGIGVGRVDRATILVLIVVQFVFIAKPEIVRIRDIFPDLEPWIDYSFSMTLSSTSDI